MTLRGKRLPAAQGKERKSDGEERKLDILANT
jgi:hypothetical protein